MKQIDQSKAVVELTELISHWLDTFSERGSLPYVPPSIAFLMAQNAVRVLEIIDVAEAALREDGMLTE